MGTELEKKDTKSQALIDTVRKTIFPNATDPELALFFHRCTIAGVNPLDQLIHPTKYRDGDDFKVVFITSINLLRSKCSESELYDGMDEPEYGEESEQAVEGGDPIMVPEYAVVKVYRKDQSRPAIGKARWKEYYPGQKKGHQWRQRPYLMLAKCAEALARRLLFPDKLNKLYTEEEMMRATEGLAGIEGKGSTKPNVTPDQVKARAPASEGWLRGNVKAAFSKSGGTAEKPWTKYSVTIGEKSYSTFDKATGENAIALKGKEVEFHIEVSGKYENLKAIRPAQVQKVPTPPETAQGSMNATSGAPEVESADAFATTIIMYGTQKGLTEAKIAGILEAEFGCGIDTVPADMQAQVLAHFEKL